PRPAPMSTRRADPPPLHSFPTRRSSDLTMTELGRRADAETVHGHCAPRFERLRDALADALATGAEVGAALAVRVDGNAVIDLWGDRKSTRLNSSHEWISYAVFCLKKKKT